MDGLLAVDKPSGPTSHDVVARVRRALRERRIGHTGTLDPMASGVLPLLIGRATRLARFMTADEKRYDAVVRLGVSTDTYDAMGRPAGPVWQGMLPDAGAIDEALARFRGTFLQQPPAYSAKKIGGERSYRLARARARDGSAAAGVSASAVEPALPSPAKVTVFALTLTGVADGLIQLSIACSSGFYVRSLAHDLGQVLGTGAHLAALRRTATSGVTLADAVPLDALEQQAARGESIAPLIPLDRMLPDLPALTLTEEGVRRVSTGQDVGPADALASPSLGASGTWRLLDPAGHLVAVAERAQPQGLLHPAVVLM